MGGTCSKDDSAAGNHDGALHNPYYDSQQRQQQHQHQLHSSSTTKTPNCWTSCAGMDTAVDPRMDSCRADAIDPVMYDLCRKSLGMTLQDEETLRRQQQQQQQLQQESAPVPQQQQQQQQPPSQPSSQANNNARTKKQPVPQKQQQQQQHFVGQFHLLYKHQSKTGGVGDGTTSTSSDAAASTSVAAVVENDISTVPTTSPYSTRLIVRRRPIAAAEEGTHGTHLYAIRYPPDDVVDHKKVVAGPNGDSSRLQEQCPTTAASPSSSGQREKKKRSAAAPSSSSSSMLDPAAEPIPEPLKPSPALPTQVLTDFFQPAKMRPAANTAKHSKQTIQEWVTVSEEHCIYVVDVGLSPAQCDKIVQVTEQVCRGQYAAYTYAKQTLGCREFPILAQACAPPVQAVVQAIVALPSNTKSSSKSTMTTATPGNDATSTTTTTSSSSTQQTSQPVQNLQLDDREPHLVKYDVTKKERQKLDMHTDKSEWTFLIALSNGCGLDYDGGGTYFECLNATIHIQRGHALIFPGKLRHCGQRITRGLRYLLVGFLVDKANIVSSNTNNNTANSNNTTANANNSATATNTGTSAVEDPKDEDSNSHKNDSTGTASSGTRPVSAKTLTSGSPSTLNTISKTIYT